MSLSLLLFVLCATPEIGAVEAPAVSQVAETPPKSQVAEKSSVTISFSKDMIDLETRIRLVEALGPVYNINVKFRRVIATGYLKINTEDEGVDLDEVTEYVWEFLHEGCNQ